MKNIIFSRRNLDFKIVDLELFSVILHLAWFYRARLLRRCYAKTLPVLNPEHAPAAAHGPIGVRAVRKCDQEVFLPA